VLDGLPGVKHLRGQVTEIYSAQSESYSGLTFSDGGVLFALKRQPLKQQPFIVLLEGGCR